MLNVYVVVRRAHVMVHFLILFSDLLKYFWVERVEFHHQASKSSFQVVRSHVIVKQVKTKYRIPIIFQLLLRLCISYCCDGLSCEQLL